jgi:hypothetical protein
MEDSEHQRWEGREEERVEGLQNPLVHSGPHPDETGTDADVHPDEVARVVEPDGRPSPRTGRQRRRD